MKVMIAVDRTVVFFLEQMLSSDVSDSGHSDIKITYVRVVSLWI